MPILFNCILVCDAEGCERKQVAVAEMRSDKSPPTLAGLLSLGTPVFDFRYDTTTGLEWVLGGGKAACSAACQAQLEAPEKGEQAPGGSGRPLKVVGDDED